jgi:hypothetical protein
MRAQSIRRTDGGVEIHMLITEQDLVSARLDSIDQEIIRTAGESGSLADALLALQELAYRLETSA